MIAFGNITEVESALGRDFGPTGWIILSQRNIDDFTRATSDSSRQLTASEVASTHPSSTSGAPEVLALALIPYFLGKLRRFEGSTMGINYGLDRVRLFGPVGVDSRVRARMSLRAVDRMGAAVQMTTRVTVEVENFQKPCCVADLISRIYW